MNKTILVTGGALRIGSEIVTSFAKMGWDIILHYRNSSEEAKKINLNALRYLKLNKYINW